jgi:thiol-disulfide isomerase/thioredoxin
MHAQMKLLFAWPLALSIGLAACYANFAQDPRGPYDPRSDANAKIEAALADARAHRKFVLLDFGANWCPACRELQSAFAAAEVRTYLKMHFNLVHIDIGNFDRNGAVTREYGFPTSAGIPAEVVLTAEGKPMTIERAGAMGHASASAPLLLAWLSSWVEQTPHAESTAPDPGPMVDAGQVRSAAETLAVRVAGESLGTFIPQLVVRNDSVFSTLTGVLHGSTVQRVVTIHDARSLRPREVWDSTNAEQVHLIYTAGRVRGAQVRPRREGPPDTLLVNQFTDAGTIDRRNFMIVIPRLALTPGMSFTMPEFDSWTMRTYPVHLTVGQRAPVTLPAGSFDAYRLDITGDMWDMPQTWYLSAETPRRILRMEWPRGTVWDLAR